MKRLGKILSFMLLAGVFAACNGDDDGGGGGTPEPTAQMTVSYGDEMGDETTWTASSVAAEMDWGITVAGSSDDQTQMFVVDVDGMEVGTYDQFSSEVTYLRTTDSTMYSSAFGEDAYSFVTITEVDTANQTVSGTFGFYIENMEDDTDFMYTENTDGGSFTDVSYATETGGGGGDDQVSVNIDGTTKTSDYTMTLLSGNTLIISGSFGGDEDLTITLPSNISSGSYDFSSNSNITYTIGDNVYMSGGTGSSGSITISSHNTSTQEISGTFSGNLIELGGGGSVSLTNGSFTASY